MTLVISHGAAIKAVDLVRALARECKSGEPVAELRLGHEVVQKIMEIDGKIEKEQPND